VSATVVYVYTSNAICSLFHEYPPTVRGLPEVQMALNLNWSSNNQPISPDRRKI